MTYCYIIDIDRFELTCKKYGKSIEKLIEAVYAGNMSSRNLALRSILNQICIHT